jgi:hypothetical protein
MNAELFNRENIDSLHWPSTPDGEYARNYLLPMIQDGPQKYIRNVYNTEVMIAKVDETLLPVTVTDFHLENTYTCSPYSHYVSYGGYEEVRHLENPPVEALIKLALHPVADWLRRRDFDRVVFVNNWLLSTNLYPSITATQLEVLSEALIGWFPERAIVFRSVNGSRDPHIRQTLEARGYGLVLSRQVWFMDPEEARRTKQYKEDARVLRRHGYEVVDGQSLSDDDLRRAVELYNLLYLEKYSYYNPQFSEHFLRLARDKGALTLRGLRRDGKLNGIMGYFARNGLMTQPLFGYDTSLPQDEGLYRLLTLVTLQEGLARGLMVHASGGVGRFKKIRGGKSATEYNAVYTQHLPRARQRPWRVIQRIGDWMIPYFKKNDF